MAVWRFGNVGRFTEGLGNHRGVIAGQENEWHVPISQQMWERKRHTFAKVDVDHRAVGCLDIQLSERCIDIWAWPDHAPTGTFNFFAQILGDEEFVFDHQDGFIAKFKVRSARFHSNPFGYLFAVEPMDAPNPLDINM
ncbi:hypothetical protein A8V01_24440 [Novosphingobium guangzhouense]|uniref:Uncharacterized protein n=1 Tax=Novosphingobium guangzhouense TaxID=1850347 RepID=A0A2K2FWS2_9SPHN|nr:hypothetical protein [Novosphingobium guangzhouense]PNU03214.1 hypothetical protein A8V01_24440 [Novosphingobium guangzhouense]